MGPERRHLAYSHRNAASMAAIRHAICALLSRIGRHRHVAVRLSPGLPAL